MRYWAELQKEIGFIYSMGQHLDDHEVEFAPPLQAIEVTSLDPMPEQGDYWDGSQFIFTATLGDKINIDKTTAAILETITISGLFNTAVIIITDVGSWKCIVPTFPFTLDYPGVYEIFVTIYPYQPVRYEINVT